MGIFEAPAITYKDDDALVICTPYGVIRFFSNGWEVERGVVEDCDGEVVLVKVREVKNGVVVKYVNGRIYAALIKEGEWPEAVIANSELELPNWARF